MYCIPPRPETVTVRVSYSAVCAVRHVLYAVCATLAMATPSLVFSAEQCDSHKKAIEHLREKGIHLMPYREWQDYGPPLVRGYEIMLRGEHFGDEDVAQVRSIRDLRWISLSESGITDEAFRHLADMPCLEGIDLSGTRVTDAQLGRLTALQGLRWLDLSDTKVTGEGLPALASLPRLETLLVNHNRISRLELVKGFPSLSVVYTERCPLEAVHLAALPRITELALSSEELNGVHVDDLPSLKNLAIAVPYQRESDDKRFCVFRLARLPNLEVLSIEARIQAGDLNSLQTMHRLRVLALRRSDVDGDALQYVRDLTSLEEIDLTSVPLSNDDLAYFKRLRNLRFLGLSDCGLDGRALPYLHDLECLERLDFASDRPVSENQLRQISGLQSLRSIELYGCRIPGEALIHLARLQKLEEVGLGDNPLVSDDDLECLTTLASLRVLDLRQCGLNGKGLQHLSTMQTIRRLALQHNPLISESLRYLANLRQLEELDLRGIQLAPAAVEHLAALTHLKRLRVSRGVFARDDLDRLREALKATEVIEL
ncbi:MAG: hypothetical protein JXB62_18085 [Pirellulales bacterium]|nr:hypothetical protein [Pirellulales bacterium]